MRLVIGSGNSREAFEFSTGKVPGIHQRISDMLAVMRHHGVKFSGERHQRKGRRAS